MDTLHVKDKDVCVPLAKMLMDLPAESLLDFCHNMNLRFNIARDDYGKYKGLVRGRGGLIYQRDSSSWKGALVWALTAFLIAEMKDYHEYL